MGTRKRTVKSRTTRAPRLTLRALAYRLDELEQLVADREGGEIDVTDLEQRVRNLEVDLMQIQRLAGLRR